jgi:hypothetical protein
MAHYLQPEMKTTSGISYVAMPLFNVEVEVEALGGRR